MAKRDYYDILGVQKSASDDEIKKAHRKLVRQYHPDVNKNNNAATEKFKEIQEAYDVLSEPDQRRKYDQFGHAGNNADPFAGQQRGRGQPQPHQSWGGGGVSVEDFEFGDLFESMFGGRAGAAPRGRTQTASPQRGNDIEYPVSLSFEDAARGRTLPLQIRLGEKVESIEIKIPAGVNTGSRVRIKGKGDRSARGHHGDLFIIVTVQPHPYYRREGLDVLLDLPISLYEAILGTKIAVPTLDGPVTLTIPPGTSSGAKLRIKSRGVERGSDKGDQLVVMKVIVPKDLDDDDRKLIEQLQEKRPVNPREDLNW